MADDVRPLDISDSSMVLCYYLKLGISYTELRAENDKLRAANKALTEQSWVVDGALLSEREENEKLRAALKPFVELDVTVTDVRGVYSCTVKHTDLASAKAALGESDE